MLGCPIRISTDHFVCADPRSFSQLITSFIASKSLGILHTPLLTFFYLFFYSCSYSYIMSMNFSADLYCINYDPILAQQVSN